MGETSMVYRHSRVFPFFPLPIPDHPEEENGDRRFSSDRKDQVQRLPSGCRPRSVAVSPHLDYAIIFVLSVLAVGADLILSAMK
jgi:hypothetical protein